MHVTACSGDEFAIRWPLGIMEIHISDQVPVADSLSATHPATMYSLAMSLWVMQWTYIEKVLAQL
jgi:hypothetical protein